MKTLHIHIGTPKTATTAIQYFCKENAEMLEKEGYCYPTFPFEYPGISNAHNGRFLMGVVKDKDGNRNTKQEEINFREGMNIVKKLFQEYEHIILSDEGIWRRTEGIKEDFWKIMVQEAEKAEFQIHVIVYLRRQDKYFLSNWNQRVKRLCSNHTIEEFTEMGDKRRLDYYGKLEQISGVVGKENITVRRFEKDNFEGGSIYADFLSIFHIALTDEYKVSQDVRNIGLYGNTHEIKRVLNIFPWMKDEKVRKYITDILQEDSEISKKEYPCEMYSKEEIRDLLECYREGNQKVAEEYLGEEPGSDLFDDIVSDLPKWQKDNPYMVDDLIRILGSVMMHLYQHEKEFEQLHQSVWQMRHPFRAVVCAVKRKVKPVK